MIGTPSARFEPPHPWPADAFLPITEPRIRALPGPEQAAWLLEGFQLDGERRLPMNQQSTGDAKGPARRPW